MRRWNIVLRTIAVCIVMLNQFVFVVSAQAQSIKLTSYPLNATLQNDVLPVPIENDWFGKGLAGLVYLVAFVVVLYFLFWFGKYMYRYIKPHLIELPATQKRVDSLLNIAKKGNEQAKSLLKSVKGQSYTVVLLAYQQLEPIMNELEIKQMSLNVTWRWIFRHTALQMLLEHTTVQLNQMEQDIRMHIEDIQKVTEAAKYIMDQLHVLKHDLIQANHKLNQLQADTQFSLHLLTTRLFEIEQNQKKAEALKVSEPIEAAQIVQHATTNLQHILKDLKYIHLYNEKKNTFSDNVKQLQEQLEVLIDEHTLVFSWSIKTVFDESFSQLPIIEQALNAGDVEIVKSIYDQMEGRLQHISSLVKQSIKLKQQLPQDLTLIEESLVQIQKATQQLEGEWDSVKKRYTTDIWKEQYNLCTQIKADIVKAYEYINDMKQCMFSEHKSYIEANQIMDKLKTIIERSKYSLINNQDSIGKWRSREQKLMLRFHELNDQFDRIKQSLEQKDLVWQQHPTIPHSYDRMVKQHVLLQQIVDQSVLHLKRFDEQLTQHEQMLEQLENLSSRLIEQRDRIRAFASSLVADYKRSLKEAKRFIKHYQVQSYQQEYELYIHRYIDEIEHGAYERADEPLQKISQLNHRLHSIIQAGKQVQLQKRNHKQLNRSIKRTHLTGSGLFQTATKKRISWEDDDDISDD